VSFLSSLLLATVAVTVFCGQAVAAPKPRVLGSSVAGVASDGRRYVAFTSAKDVVRVYDMRDRSSYSLAAPCPLTDGAFGRFLLDCDDHVRLLRARTRRTRVVTVPEKFRATEWVELGRYWLRGWELLDDLIDANFLNWRDGSTKYGPEDMRADLDRRRFHRKPSSELDREYEGSSGGLDLYCRWHDGDDRTTLELRRSGQSRPAVVLHRRRRSCAPSRLRHGVAIWEASGFVHAYVIRSGRTFRWRGSDPAHTRGWIVFLRATGESRRRVLYARLPGTRG
jgi:hypothetical protein